MPANPTAGLKGIIPGPGQAQPPQPTGEPGSSKENPMPVTDQTTDAQVKTGQFVKRTNGSIWVKDGPGKYRMIQRGVQQ